MSNSDQNNGKGEQARPLPVVIGAIDRLSNAFSYVAAAALILLVLSVFIDVIGRKFFNAPFTGALEMTANWWMPTLTLLAFGFTERLQEHIKVTILLDALPTVLRQAIEGSFGLLATGLLIALAYYTFGDALKSASFGETTASTPPVAIWPFKFVAVAGIAVLALQSGATTYRYFVGLLPRSQSFDNEADLG